MSFLLNPDCACCEDCPSCTEQTLPLTFSGFTNGNCATCGADMNTTYLVAFTSSILGRCNWDYDGIGPCGHPHFLISLAIYFSNPNWYISVFVRYLGLTVEQRFIKNCGASMPDCTATHTLGIDYVTEPPGYTPCLAAGTGSCQLN